MTDAGNFSVDEATVSVLYNFSGFFQPVDNLPTLNAVKAGQAIPVKFSLNGDQGLSIFAAGYPRSSVLPALRPRQMPSSNRHRGNAACRTIRPGPVHVRLEDGEGLGGHV